MMRVLLVSARGADRAFGGAERYLDLLRAGLQARGHAVAVLAAYPARDDASPARVTRRRTDPLVDPIRRVHDRLDGFLAGVPADLEAALDDVDIVHTNNLPGIGTGIWELARRRGLPVVHTLHDYGLRCARSSLRRRDGAPCPPSPVLCGVRARRLARWTGGVQVVIAVSAHVLTRHADMFAPPSATIVIDPPRVAAADARPAGPGLRRLGYVGALTREKGVDVLVRCAPALLQGGVSVSVAGAGPLAGLVRAAPVTYVGHLNEPALRRFFADHDAGIVCSAWEEPAVTFAALDWLGARRPVIVSDRGALAELAGTPGVVSCDGSGAGVLDAVARARAPGAWERLRGELTAPPPADDLGRWIDEHLAAYATARERVAG